MRGVFLRPAAEAEVEEIYDWYENQRPGLGEEFLSEFEAAVERVGENPFQFPRIHRDIRRALLKRFPYALFFRMICDEAAVIACYHGRRDPRRWRDRE